MTALPRIERCAGPSDFDECAAGLISQAVKHAVAERGGAQLALSGGNTPLGAYRLLAAEPTALAGATLWFADERCVGPEHSESNYRALAEIFAGPPMDSGRQDAREAGADSARMPGSAPIMRMRGELGPERGAADYEALLARHIAGSGDQLPQLDLVVLGIGPEGHIASLFPNAAALEAPAGHSCVAVEDSPKPPPQRISLTLTMLQRARRCLLLASGAGKARALAAALDAPSAAAPSSLLPRERLTVIADRAAAELLGAPAASEPRAGAAAGEGSAGDGGQAQ